MSVDALAPGKRLEFEFAPPFEDGLAASVVDVVGRDVAQGLVVSLGVVIVDEGVDFAIECIRGFPDRQVDPLLARTVVALDLAVGLGVIGRSQDVADAALFQVVPEIGRDERRLLRQAEEQYQVASTEALIKPVVYLTAIESGLTLASVVKDQPITITPKYGEAWTPKNFDGKYRGELPLIRALAQSLNLATVNLGVEVGLQRNQTLMGQWK